MPLCECAAKEICPSIGMSTPLKNGCMITLRQTALMTSFPQKTAYVLLDQ